jgi:hypothetical protein
LYSYNLSSVRRNLSAERKGKTDGRRVWDSEKHDLKKQRHHHEGE